MEILPLRLTTDLLFYIYYIIDFSIIKQQCHHRYYRHCRQSSATAFCLYFCLCSIPLKKRKRKQLLSFQENERKTKGKYRNDDRKRRSTCMVLHHLAITHANKATQVNLYGLGLYLYSHYFIVQPFNKQKKEKKQKMRCICENLNLRVSKHTSMQ